MSENIKHIISPEELMAFMDGQIGEARRRAVEEHLKACPQCRSMLESLELAEREAVRAEEVEAPEGYFKTFASRVANRIAREELAPVRRPWLLRWGWMPAAAAAAFAVVMVLSHGLFDQPIVQEAALKRQIIPIPIAPEPRIPETVAVLETYYEEAPAAPATEGAPSEKDKPAASGVAQPAPVAAAPAVEISADEVSSVSRTRAASSPGLVDLSGAPSAPTALDAKSKSAGVVKRSAPDASLETAEKTQPPSAPTTPSEAKESEPAKSDDRDKTEPAHPQLTMEARRRLVRIRQVGASRVLLPPEPPADSCPAPVVSTVEAIVIHLPNGDKSTEPGVEPAVRLCLPQ